MSVTINDVASWLGQSELSTADEVLATRCLSAVIAHVHRNYDVPQDSAFWQADLEQAVTMWAARLWRRKESPQGVAEFPDLGSVFVRSTDPDIQALLTPYTRLPGVA